MPLSAIWTFFLIFIPIRHIGRLHLDLMRLFLLCIHFNLILECVPLLTSRYIEIFCHRKRRDGKPCRQYCCRCQTCPKFIFSVVSSRGLNSKLFIRFFHSLIHRFRNLHILSHNFFHLIYRIVFLHFTASFFNTWNTHAQISFVLWTALFSPYSHPSPVFVRSL